VKALAASALSGKLGGDVEGPGEVRSAVSSVYSDLQAKGLHGIKVVPKAPGEFDILASASPFSIVWTVISRMERQRRKNIDLVERDFKVKVEPVLDDEGKPRKNDEGEPMERRRGIPHTAAIGTWNGHALTRQQSLKVPGEGDDKHDVHAEQYLVAEVRRDHKDDLRQAVRTAEDRKSNTMTLMVTKSPCGACSSLLGRFVDAFNVKLTVQPLGLYGDTTEKRQESIQGMKMLREKGVEFEVPTVEEVLGHVKGGKLDEASREGLELRLEKVGREVKAINEETHEMAGINAG
jgi:hypothetical protein